MIVFKHKSSIECGICLKMFLQLIKVSWVEEQVSPFCSFQGLASSVQLIPASEKHPSLFSGKLSKAQ